MEERKIIHIDMDAFFAAVEQRDNPELRGKPVAVGFDGPRGVVSTASYEARKWGVHSAQSIAQAKQRCPDLIIVPCRHSYYAEISHQIHQIFQEYTDLIEPISIDEAFLDVTHNKKGIELAVDIAKEIKARIKEATGLTASAGISYCKFLAKVASDYRKPDGICTIHPDKALDFIAQLPVEDFWGVGKKTLQKMHFMGIYNGADLTESFRRTSRRGIRQSRTHLLPFCKRHRRTTCHHLPGTEIGGMRTDFPGGYLCQIGCDYRTVPYGTRTAGANRQERFRRKNPDAEGEVCRFHPDNTQHLAREDSEEEGRYSTPCQATASTGRLLF